MSKQTMVKKAARNKNGRKRAEKIFALYAPFPYYFAYYLILFTVKDKGTYFQGHYFSFLEIIILIELYF